MILIVSVVLFGITINKCYTNKKKNQEKYMNLCRSNNYLQEYVWNDNQNAWYAEFTNEHFKEYLSNTKFELLKSDKPSENGKTQLIFNWINEITRFKKANSKLNVISLNVLEDQKYELVIHRNGRNHGKVIHMQIIENQNKIVLSEIQIVGVISQYEIDDETSLKLDMDSKHLKYNNIEDMWQLTNDEIIMEESSI
jgi:hypothetical protein